MRSHLVLFPILPLATAITTSYEVLDINWFAFPSVTFIESKTLLGSMISSNAEAATIGITCMPSNCGTATIINGSSTFSEAVTLSDSGTTEMIDINCRIQAGKASCKADASLMHEKQLVSHKSTAVTVPVPSGLATITAVEGESRPTAAPSTTTNSMSTPPKTSSETGSGATGDKPVSGINGSTDTLDAAAPTKVAGLLGAAGLAVGIAAAAL